MDLRPEICRAVLVTDDFLHNTDWSKIVERFLMGLCVVVGTGTVAIMVTVIRTSGNPTGSVFGISWASVLVAAVSGYRIPRWWRRLVKWAETPDRVARDLNT